MLDAAKREFAEETGVAVDGPFIPLEPCRQAGGKLVHAWAVRGDFNPEDLRSNVFSMEWPPRSGKSREFPEIDRVGWFSLDTARRKILKGQIGFVLSLAGLAKPVPGGPAA